MRIECSLCVVRYGTEDGVVLWISCDLCSKWMQLNALK